MIVYVYRNLHRKTWSLQRGGKVVGHQSRVLLLDVELRVRPGGRARVLRERRKSVHAFAVGHWWAAPWTEADGGREITYDPYAGPTFTFKDTGEPILRAERVELRADGTVWAWVPEGEKV
jgi:hypothetical protein